MSKLVQKWKRAVGCVSKKESLIENDFLQTDGAKESSRANFRDKRNCSLPLLENRRFNLFATKSHSCDHHQYDADESSSMLASPDAGSGAEDLNNNVKSCVNFNVYENESAASAATTTSKNKSFLIYQNKIEELNGGSHKFGFMKRDVSESDTSLKDASNTSLAMRSLKRVLGSKASFSRSQREKEKYTKEFAKEKNGFDYDELADSPLLVQHAASKDHHKKLKSSKSARTFTIDENNNQEFFHDDTHIYYEIDKHSDASTEDEPLLINFAESEPAPVVKAAKPRNDSKNNLFDDQQQRDDEPDHNYNNDNEDDDDDDEDDYYESLSNTNKNDYYSLEPDDIPKYILSRTSLSMSSETLAQAPAFASLNKQYQEFNAYLNNIFDTMTTLVEHEQRLSADERQKRLCVLTAHLLYSRSYYEMQVGSPVSQAPTSASAAGSSSRASQQRHQRQQQVLMSRHHPCMIALACLLDSDAVKVVESHSCAFDEYIYLFETRLKFCSWKCKLFVILKRPKRSSIKRLTFIEQLTSCHKQLKEKRCC